MESSLKVVACHAPTSTYYLISSIASHALAIAMLLFCILTLYMFIRRFQHFPIKQRSPYLCVLQCISFMINSFVPYLIQLWQEFIDSSLWSGVTDLDNVPMSRRILKGIFFFSRISCYVVFSVRILVIYRKWKLRKSKGMYIFWLFLSDKRAFIV